MGSRRGPDFYDDSAILFRLLARRLAETSRADFLAQPIGPARSGWIGLPNSFDSGRAGPSGSRRSRIVRLIANLRKTRRNRSGAKALRGINRRRAAARDGPRGTP